jgi:hypothetical protein
MVTVNIKVQQTTDTGDWRVGLVVLPAGHVYGKTALTGQEWTALEARRAKVGNRDRRVLADVEHNPRRVVSAAVDPDQPVDRAGMLRILAEAVAGGLPAPMTINLHLHASGNRVLEVRMDDNRANEVDAWAHAVSPDSGASGVLGGQVFDSGIRPWRVYSYGYGHDVLWHGWTFEVWSSVDEPEANPS